MWMSLAPTVPGAKVRSTQSLSDFSVTPVEPPEKARVLSAVRPGCAFTSSAVTARMATASTTSKPTMRRSVRRS